jgi:pyruvate/2-oxoglutarate dehydrogenase complex dihydrolipoamide dehydrogenase (E3) component
VESNAEDHKGNYPGAHSIRIRITADAATRRLLGVQMVGHKDAAVAKRIDVAATAIHHRMTVNDLADLDLSYTPPLGQPVGRGSDGRTRLGTRHAQTLDRRPR